MHHIFNWSKSIENDNAHRNEGLCFRFNILHLIILQNFVKGEVRIVVAVHSLHTAG